jgi:hypothetical protein
MLEGLGALDASGRALWDMGKFARGYAYEDEVSKLLIGSGTGWSRLTYGFKTMDFFNEESGAILSLKTLNLGADSYQSYTAVNRVMKGYVDSVDAFTTGARGDDVIRAEMVTSKSLAVVLPQTQMSYQQAWALYSAFEYASARGVDLTYVVTR